MLRLTRYQWIVLFAAWLGWGFDIFDGLLFNYVAPNAVPTLLGLPIGSPEAKQATLFWTGLLTSILLVGWAVGGVVFGLVCDRIGRTRTLLITMPPGNYPLLILAIILEGFAYPAASTMLDKLVAISVDPAERARIMAFLYLGMILFTSPFGWIAGQFSEIDRKLPFVLNIGIYILGALLAFFASRRALQTAAARAEPA